MENKIASSARLGGRIGDKGGRLSGRAAERQSNNRQGAGRQLLQISNAAQASEVWGKKGMEGIGEGNKRKGDGSSRIGQFKGLAGRYGDIGSLRRPFEGEARNTFKQERDPEMYRHAPRESGSFRRMYLYSYRYAERRTTNRQRACVRACMELPILVQGMAY